MKMINKYVEGGTWTNHQKQSYFYGTERSRDLKIVFQKRLSKVKSHWHLESFTTGQDWAKWYILVRTSTY